MTDQGSLADLLVRRGRLRPGEVVTVVAPIAMHVAETHARGDAFGGLSATSIRFDADGRPVLAGTAAAVGVDGPMTDVRTLVGLVRRCLGDGSDPGAAAVLAATSSAASAESLAAALLAATPAEPIDFIRDVVVETIHTLPPGHRRHALVAVAVLLVAVVAAVVAGVSSAPRTADGFAALPSLPRPTPSAVVTATPSVRPPWKRIVEQLEQRRVRALTTHNASLLTRVYASSSPALRADRATVRALTRRGVTPTGLTAHVHRVVVRSVSSRRVVLRVVDAMSPHPLVWTLVPSRHGWRISALTR